MKPITLKPRYFPIFIITLLGLTIGCVKSPTSPGSGQWEEATAHAPFSGRYGLSGTVFNGLMWVIGGAAGNADESVTYYDSDVWSSSNGSSWTQATANAAFGGRYGSQVVSYNGQMWLIGGDNGGTLMNDVWSSSDGANWTQVLASTAVGTVNQFSPREDFGALVFNNAMWVIGGYGRNPVSLNDVWTSTNGVAWTQVLANDTKTSATQFSGRWGHSALVFNNEMWVVSGAGATIFALDPPVGATEAYGDAWSSPNGTVWTQVANLNPYGPSYFHQVVANGSLMWLTGGFLWPDGGPQATVWTTGNGSSWSNVYSPFPQRFYHLGLAYNNEVWVIAGCDNYCGSAVSCAVTYLNDVWYNQ